MCIYLFNGENKRKSHYQGLPSIINIDKKKLIYVYFKAATKRNELQIKCVC